MGEKTWGTLTGDMPPAKHHYHKVKECERCGDDAITSEVKNGLCQPCRREFNKAKYDSKHGR